MYKCAKSWQCKYVEQYIYKKLCNGDLIKHVPYSNHIGYMQKGIQQVRRYFTSIHEVSFFEANLIPKHGCAPANPDGQSTYRFTVGEVKREPQTT
jgi:hypothetical protein